MARDRLTNLLRDWAAGHMPDKKRLDDLAGRIHDAVARSGRAGWTEEERPRRLWRVSWARLAYAGLGAAVALLAVWASALFDGEGGGPAAPAPSDLARVPRADRHAGARIFAEVERLFGGKLQWVADSADDFRLGLSSYDVSPEQAEPFLVRIVVVSRAAGERSWRRAWDTTILARPNEWLEVQPEADGRNHISLWLHPMPDGTVAVESGLRLRHPIETSCTTTGVLKPGRPTRVLTLSVGGIEYQVFQSVAALPAGEC